MLARVAFLHTADERLIALSEIVSTAAPRTTRFSLTTFDHENTFIKLVATADLPTEVTTEIIAAVLLSVARPTFPHRWVEMDLTEPQIEELGLHAESVEAAFVSSAEIIEANAAEILRLDENAEQFHDFLMQAPTPFIMLSGPRHHITFINPPYVRLIGRLTSSSVLGKTIQEALPELEGQPFFGLLDRVFRTGVPYVGQEVPATLKSEKTGESSDHYFDFIYHPLRNAAGDVSGMMVQATDVTERVISREAANSREEKLYTQWQELEAIYRTAPVGLVLLDAKELTILQINPLEAEAFGRSVADLKGKKIGDAGIRAPAFKQLLERVLRGEPVQNTIIEAAEHEQRRWLVNITPFKDGSGAIDKLHSISLEIPIGN